MDMAQADPQDFLRAISTDVKPSDLEENIAIATGLLEEDPDLVKKFKDNPNIAILQPGIQEIIKKTCNQKVGHKKPGEEIVESDTESEEELKLHADQEKAETIVGEIVEEAIEKVMLVESDQDPVAEPETENPARELSDSTLQRMAADTDLLENSVDVQSENNDQESDSDEDSVNVQDDKLSNSEDESDKDKCNPKIGKEKKFLRLIKHPVSIVTFVSIIVYLCYRYPFLLTQPLAWSHFFAH